MKAATRFYLSNAAEDKTLPTVKGTWSNSASTLTRLLGVKSGAAATQAFTGSGSNANNLIGRWQSLPLAADTSFSGAEVQYVVGAKNSSTTNTVQHFRIHIFVVQSDGTTVRGTLVNNVIGTGTAFTTTATGRTDGALNLGAVSALAGDRIVVEIGCNRTGSSTASRICTFNYGNTGTTDLTSTNTSVTTRPGWVEFSNAVTTAAGTAPTVTTQAVSAITYSTATGNATVTLDNGFPVTERGVVWNTSGTPTTSDSKSTAAGTTGAFTASMTGLAGGTTYYVRGYAINSVGTSYGNEVNFVTAPAAPGTPTLSDITATTLRVNWTAPAGGANSYKVERCAGSGCVNFSEIATGVTNTYFDDSGLSVNTLYRYRVRGTSVVGDGEYSGAVDNTVVSVTVGDGLVEYGVLGESTSQNTNSGGLNDTQITTNNGNVAIDLTIKGQNSTAWTLAATAGNNQYVHKFCITSCASPPTNFTALTLNGQALVTNLAPSGTQAFDLQLTAPSSSDVYSEQSVDVIVTATAH